MLLKDEICAGIWKLPKEFEGGGWKFEGGSWKFKGESWKFEGGSGGGGGSGKEPLIGGNDGGEGGGERLLLLLLLLFIGSKSFNLFNRFSISKFHPGGSAAFFIRLLASDFFPTSRSLRSEPTIGFSVSKVEMSSKTSSRGSVFSEYFYL